MKMYLLTIGVAMTVTSAFNIAFQTASWYYIIIAVIWCTALQFALDAAVAILVKLSPDSWYGIDNRYFNVSEREKSIYKALRVRSWKDKVWELGSVGGFSKKSLARPDDPDYIKRFIIECNKGVVTHRLSYLVGFLSMLTMFNVSSFTIALPIATVNMYLNVLPTLVLRYNTPKLKSKLILLNRKKSVKQEVTP